MIETSVGPPPGSRYRRGVHLRRSLRSLWAGREVLVSLVERDLRARYKQTFLGFAWALITPVLLMLVFTVFLHRVTSIATGGVPYALFSYVGILPWSFFATAVSQGGMSLLSNMSLLNKIYCPREYFPLASVGIATTDTIIALVPLVLLFLINGFLPRGSSVWVPLLLLVLIAQTTGIALITSVVVVYLRDVRHALPLLLQLGLFVTPVAYGIEAVPAGFRPLYVAVNPLAAVIDGLRRSVLLGQRPHLGLLAVAACSASATMLLGYAAFKRMETGIADVA